jgi:hypothetical protein
MQVRSDPAHDRSWKGGVEQVDEQLVVIYHIESFRKVDLEEHCAASRLPAVETGSDISVQIVQRRDRGVRGSESVLKIGNREVFLKDRQQKTFQDLNGRTEE